MSTAKELSDRKWPQTEEELLKEVREAIQKVEAAGSTGEGYNACPEAMARAALAAFRYVGHTLGVTGFQASCADLMFLAATRRMEHGFMVLDAENLLYPQYDLRGKTDKWIKKTEPQLAGAAQKLLAERGAVHPDVRARWVALAAMKAGEPT